MAASPDDYYYTGVYRYTGVYIKIDEYRGIHEKRLESVTSTMFDSCFKNYFKAF